MTFLVNKIVDKFVVLNYLLSAGLVLHTKGLVQIKKDTLAYTLAAIMLIQELK